MGDNELRRRGTVMKEPIPIHLIDDEELHDDDELSKMFHPKERNKRTLQRNSTIAKLDNLKSRSDHQEKVLERLKLSSERRVCCCISGETVDFAVIITKAVVHLFKMVIGSLLMFFVPHVCETASLRECTFNETVDVFGITDARLFAVLFNFCTIFFLGFHLYMSVKRERFLSKTLDYNPNKPIIAIRKVLHKYPLQKKDLRKVNKRTLATSMILLFIVVSNITLSGYVLFLDRFFGGYKTVTVFVTNILGVLQISFNDFKLLKISFRKNVAISCEASQPIWYNAIDPDILEELAERRRQKILNKGSKGKTSQVIQVQQSARGEGYRAPSGKAAGPPARNVSMTELNQPEP